MLRRSSIFALSISLVFGSALAACGPTNNTTDTGVDSGDVNTVDAANDVAMNDTVTTTDGATDTGSPDDTGAPNDAATDAGTMDASILDASGPVDASSDTSAADTGSSDTGEPMCAPNEHVCTCASGFYCVRIGVGCLAPGAPCPL